jgi:hypothetical protein
MDIHRTPQQLRAIDAERGSAPRMIDPRNYTAYVLVSEEEYEKAQASLENERQRVIHARDLADPLNE